MTTKTEERPKVYETLIVVHEPGDDDKPGKSTIVGELSRVLAKTDQDALILAARSIPEDYVSQLENVEVIVRPF